MFNFVHTHLKHLNLWIEWLVNLDILIRVLSDITLNIVYKPVYVFKFVCSEPIYSSKHSSVQARLNLHRHKLLKQQFAGVSPKVTLHKSSERSQKCAVTWLLDFNKQEPTLKLFTDTSH